MSELVEAIDDLLDKAKVGLIGLAGVVGGIAAWDLLASETISNGVRRIHDRMPVAGRVITLSVLSGTAVHLCLDADKDPFQRAVTLAAKAIAERKSQ